MPLTESSPTLEMTRVEQLREQCRELIERLGDQGLSEAAVILTAIVTYDEAEHSVEEARGQFLPYRRLPPREMQCPVYESFD